jgi:hypothetical protein
LLSTICVIALSHVHPQHMTCTLYSTHFYICASSPSISKTQLIAPWQILTLIQSSSM